MMFDIKRHSSTLNALYKSAAGNTSVLFAMSIVPIVGIAGGAIDYLHAQAKVTEIQANLDAATLAGVSGTVLADKQIITAQAYFKRFEDTANQSYDEKFTFQDGKLTGTVTGEVQTSLLKVLGIESIPIDAKAVATSGMSLEPLCLMAMHPTRKHTLEMKGSVSLFAPDCNIYGNSNHWNDVVDPHTPQNFMTGKFIAAIGGGHHFLENVKPSVEFGTKVIADPLASLPIPAAGACAQTEHTVLGLTQTLTPGHYCKGLTIKNGSKVTLENGGTYYISGGSFAIDSSTVVGENVTIFLMDEDSTVEWGESTIRIGAKETGTYAGLAVVGKSVSKGNAFEDSTIDIHGVFYMPYGAFEWQNEGTPVVTAKWSAFVVDGFSWTGSGTINVNFKPGDSSIPYPAALNVMPRPDNVRLIQ